MFWSPGTEDDDKPGVGQHAQEALTGNEALLTGIVTDGAENKPISGATLEIDHAGGPSTVRTGATGRYRAKVDAYRRHRSLPRRN